MADIKKGQRWYAGLPGKAVVDEVKVLDVTEQTVLLEVTDTKASVFGLDYHYNLRYEVKRVHFIELADKKESQAISWGKA